jgi:hypothetical protein
MANLPPLSKGGLLVRYLKTLGSQSDKAGM